MTSAPRATAQVAAHSVYLDHAATTPMLPAAIEAMTAVFGTVGNASSLHGSGRAARRRVEESRESIAADLGARPSEVIFVSGGTESDNLAVKGIYRARRAADPRRTRILVSAVEHHAVLDAVAWLAEREGAQVTSLPVDEQGIVASRCAARRTRAPRRRDRARHDHVGEQRNRHDHADRGSRRRRPRVRRPDAQRRGAGGRAATRRFQCRGLSAASITAHKLGGPLGVGVLLLGRDVDCEPMLHGGGHERDLRSGTPDTPGVVGMAAALRTTVADLPVRDVVLGELRDELIAGVQRLVPDAKLNGPVGAARLPGNAHFTFPGCEGDSLLMLLDAAGIECSTGSACTAGVAQPSHVLLALGADPRESRGSLRFSLGHTSTRSDVEALFAALPQVIERAKAAGLASVRGAFEGGEF